MTRRQQRIALIIVRLAKLRSRAEDSRRDIQLHERTDLMLEAFDEAAEQ